MHKVDRNIIWLYMPTLMVSLNRLTHIILQPNYHAMKSKDESSLYLNPFLKNLLIFSELPVQFVQPKG